MLSRRKLAARISQVAAHALANVLQRHGTSGNSSLSFGPAMIEALDYEAHVV